MKFNSVGCWILPACFLASVCLQSAAEEIRSVPDPEVNIEVIADDLRNPCGVAVHPVTGEIWISESAGAKILRVENAQVREAIVGFETETYGRSPGYQIGPLGIAFVNSQQLLVGEGGRTAGQDRLMMFAVSSAKKSPDDADCTTMLKADQMPFEGNFHGVTVVGDSVFATSHGDDTNGWIVRAEFKDGKLGVCRRFAGTSNLNVHAPTAITTTPDGNLLISLFGETNVRNDSAIVELDIQGRIVSEYFTGLNDVTGIAFHPSSKKLYAVDFSWIDVREGGLYELTDLDSVSRKCKARKICSLSHPTAMAFDDEGNLWVAVVGNNSSDPNKYNGQLLKITGLP